MGGNNWIPIKSHGGDNTWNIKIIYKRGVKIKNDMILEIKYWNRTRVSPGRLKKGIANSLSLWTKVTIEIESEKVKRWNTWHDSHSDKINEKKAKQIYYLNEWV